jgi:hypothetical protein
MSWDDVKEGSGAYVSLTEDGQSFMGVFVGEPTKQMIQKQGGGERKSFIFNVVVGEDEAAKIFRCGVRLADKIKAALTVIGDKRPGALAGKVALTITRHGKAKSTDTTYDVKVSKLSPAEIKGVGKVKLIDLAKVETPEESLF